MKNAHVTNKHKVHPPEMIELTAAIFRKTDRLSLHTHTHHTTDILSSDDNGTLLIKCNYIIV